MNFIFFSMFYPLLVLKNGKQRLAAMTKYIKFSIFELIFTGKGCKVWFQISQIQKDQPLFNSTAC